MPTEKQIEAAANTDWFRMMLIADLIELQIWRDTFPRRAMEIHNAAKRRAVLEVAKKEKDK